MEAFRIRQLATSFLLLSSELDVISPLYAITRLSKASFSISLPVKK